MNKFRVTRNEYCDKPYWLETRPDIRSSGVPWMVVEMFPTLKLAKAAQAAAVHREIAAINDSLHVSYIPEAAADPDAGGHAEGLNPCA